MVLIPGLTVTEVGPLDTNGKGDEVEGTQTLESRTIFTEVKKAGETLDGPKKTVVTDKPRHEVEEEEEEKGMLVAGLHLQVEHREKLFSHGQEREENKGGNEELRMERVKNAKQKLAERGREDRKVASDLTPPPIMTRQGALTMFPATKPATANHILVSTEAPDKVTSSLFEERTREVLQSPAHHLRMQNELKGQTSPRETHGTEEANQFKPSGLILEMQAATPKTTLELTTTYSKTRELLRIQKSSKNTMTPTESAGKSQTSKRPKNKMKVTAMQNKPSPAQPHVTKPSVEVQMAAVVAASVKQVKGNQTSDRKNADKLKEKKKKNDNRTQKRAKVEKVAAPTHFPYFLDDYCPPECACYGR